MVEVLIIFKAPPSPRVVADLRSRFAVKALAPPRIAVLHLQENQVQDLQRMPGLEAVLQGPSSPSPPSLTEQERLFITGWQQQQQGEGGKRRKGEGLPWDAEGYLPPDRPKSQ
ncbi:MAG: hypothetical protein R3B37_07420 [Nitrospira sp.]|nr:hypothetical protein [Nitrospira sp.]